MNQRQAALKHGWRSGLEESVGKLLGRKGVEFGYETVTIPFRQPAKNRRYTPDFILPNGIVLETKGRFTTADRQKMKWIKAQYPDLDIRFVFSRSSSRISKQSKTTYRKWCDDHGFPWADKEPPDSWLTAPPNARSLSVLSDLQKGAKK